jgi:hypothetical protein
MKPGTEWEEGSRKGRRKERWEEKRLNETRGRAEMRAAENGYEREGGKRKMVNENRGIRKGRRKGRGKQKEVNENRSRVERGHQERKK